MTKAQKDWPAVELERIAGSVSPFLCYPPVGSRSESERYIPETGIREWLTERRDHEMRMAPKERNIPAAGVTMGALETIDAMVAWLDGEEE